MTSPRKNRIRSVDYLKGLLIVSVVVCHATERDGALAAWIYSFCIPAFFFASGLFLKVSPPTPAEAAGEVRRRFISLMVPYFLWSLLWLLVWGALTPMALAAVLYGGHKGLIWRNALTSLWFLPVLFLGCTGWAAARLALGERFVPWVRAALGAAAFATAFLLPTVRIGWPWGADIACCAFGCLAAGNLAAPAIARLRSFASRGGAAPLLPLLLSAIGFSGTMAWSLNLPPNGYVNVANAAYGNPFLFLALGACGTLFAVCLSVFLEAVAAGEKAWLLRWLELLGTNSLGILCLHRFFLRPLQPWAASLALPKPVPDLLCAAVVLLASALLSALISRIFPPAVGLPFRRRDGGQAPHSRKTAP